MITCIMYAGKDLERGIEEGLYRPEINIEIMARYRVETMLTSFNPEFQRNVKLGPAAIEKEIIIHYLLGLVSSKGYKLALKYMEKKLSIK